MHDRPIIATLRNGIIVIALVSATGFAFGEGVKKRARERGDFYCKKCDDAGREQRGEYQAHHIVREVDGGSPEMCNLMWLCPECHQEWDLKAEQYGELANGIHMRDVLGSSYENMVKNKGQFRSSLRRVLESLGEGTAFLDDPNNNWWKRKNR